MANIIRILPEVEGDEMVFLQGITGEMTEQQQEQFAHLYRARRKDPQTVLLLALLGLFPGVAGIHRIVLGQIGIGVLYLLTAGLCVIGTIVDLFNHKKLAFEYNQKVAQEAAVTVLREF